MKKHLGRYITTTNNKYGQSDQNLLIFLVAVCLSPINVLIIWGLVSTEQTFQFIAKSLIGLNLFFLLTALFGVMEFRRMTGVEPIRYHEKGVKVPIGYGKKKEYFYTEIFCIKLLFKKPQFYSRPDNMVKGMNIYAKKQSAELADEIFFHKKLALESHEILKDILGEQALSELIKASGKYKPVPKRQ